MPYIPEKGNRQCLILGVWPIDLELETVNTLYSDAIGLEACGTPKLGPYATDWYQDNGEAVTGSNILKTVMVSNINSMLKTINISTEESFEE